MNDNPAPETKQAPAQVSSPKTGGSTGSDGQPSHSSPGLTTSDPVRRDFSDKAADASKKTNPTHADERSSKDNRAPSGAQADQSGGERKGSRTDATRVASDNRSSGERASSSNSSNQKMSATPAQALPQPSRADVPATTSSDSGDDATQPDVKTQVGGIRTD